MRYGAVEVYFWSSPPDMNLRVACIEELIKLALTRHFLFTNVLLTYHSKYSCGGHSCPKLLYSSLNSGYLHISPVVRYYQRSFRLTGHYGMHISFFGMYSHHVLEQINLLTLKDAINDFESFVCLARWM